MSKLEQIIYTRGCPRIGFSGDIQDSEGYGILYMSQGIANVSAPKDALFLTKILQMTNSSVDEGEHLGFSRNINSIIYTLPAVGDPIMTSVHYRDSSETALSQKHGRPVYLSDAIVGNLNQYPCMYFGANCFKAIKTPIDDFYRDAPMEMGDAMDTESIQFDESIRERAMAFAKNGNADLVKAAVWHLLKQLALPEAERKFIIIRDTEENVRLWIAAITLSLPLQYAEQVSFNTNARVFNDLKMDLQYCVQKATQLYERNFNIQNPNLERRSFALIVGADPRWSGSDVTKTVKAMNPYVVIDAETKQLIGFEPDQEINNAYYRAIVEKDSEIDDFCKILAELKPLKGTESLGDMYSICQTLSGDADYSYSSLIHALQTMQPYFTAHSCLMMHVINQLFGRGQQWHRLAGDDEKNGLLLTGIALKLIETYSMVSFSQPALSAIKERITQKLRGAQDVAQYTNVLMDMAPQSVKQILVEIIDHEKMQAVEESSIDKGSDEFILDLFDFVGCYCKVKGISFQNALSDPNLNTKLSCMLRRSVTNERLAGQVVNLFHNDQQMLEYYMRTGADLAGSDVKRRLAWWDCMIDSHVSVEVVCSVIAMSGKAILDVEHVLCRMIRKTGCTEEIRNLFRIYLKNVVGAGKAYYREWYESTLRAKDSIAALKVVLRELENDRQHIDSLQEILTDLDKTISLSDSKKNTDLINLILQYASQAQVDCHRSELWMYIDNMTGKTAGGIFGKKDRDGVVGQYIKVNPKNHAYVIANDSSMPFAETQMGEKFIHYIAEHCDEAASFVIATMSFDFDSAGDKNRFYDAIAEEICVPYIKRKDESVALLIYLRDCIEQRIALKGDPVERLISAYDVADLKRELNALIDACSLQLKEIKLDNVADKLISSCSKNFGKRTAANLERILDEAQRVYSQNHKGGLFGRLFGKK